MFNFIKDYFEYRRCRRSVKCRFEPCDEFLNECRNQFLSQLKARHNGRTSVSYLRLNPILKYGLTGIFSVMILSGGAIVYADKQNVAVGHPLYSLKRIGENIRLTFANSSVRPVIYNELAGRRFQEYAQTKSLSGRVLSDEKNKMMMINLNHDFHHEVKNVLVEVVNNKIETNRADQLCSSVSKMMRGENVSEIEEIEKERSEVMNKIMDSCANFMQREKQSSGGKN